MPTSLELVIDLVKLGPHPFLDRDALQPELSAPALPADVRQAQEVERVRLAEPTLRPIRCGVPSGVSDQLPSSITPAFSHFRIRRKTRLSAIRCSRNFISQA